MKALVTGANGLIGFNLVQTLITEGVQVRALIRPGSDPSWLSRLPVEIVYADVTLDDGALAAAAAGVEFLFHTAMHFTYTGRSAQELETTAISGTENVFRAAAAGGVRRIVVTSSSVVFGYNLTPGAVRDEGSTIEATAAEPPYVVAKIKQHQHALMLADKMGMDAVLVCPTMSVGPHGRTLGPSNGIIVAYLNDPVRCTYPGGCNIVSVTDIARGHWNAAQYGKRGAHYILGSENLEWRQIHALVAELCGVRPPQMGLNHSLSYLASTAEELRAWIAGKPALTSREQASMIGRFYWYSHGQAATLGYRPQPAREALAEAISWLAMSSHISREVRTSLRLHPDVYASRRSMQ